MIIRSFFLLAAFVSMVGSPALSQETNKLQEFLRGVSKDMEAMTTRCYKMGYWYASKASTYKSFGFLADLAGNSGQLEELNEIGRDQERCVFDFIEQVEGLNAEIQNSNACSRFKSVWDNFSRETIGIASETLLVGGATSTGEYSNRGLRTTSHVKVSLRFMESFTC